MTEATRTVIAKLQRRYAVQWRNLTITHGAGAIGRRGFPLYSAEIQLNVRVCAPPHCRLEATDVAFSAVPIPQHFARAVVSGHAAHAPARMCTGSAQVQARDARPVIGMTQQRSCGPQLIESERAMKDVCLLYTSDAADE